MHVTIRCGIVQKMRQYNQEQETGNAFYMATQANMVLQLAFSKCEQHKNNDIKTLIKLLEK